MRTNYSVMLQLGYLTVEARHYVVRANGHLDFYVGYAPFEKLVASFTHGTWLFVTEHKLQERPDDALDKIMASWAQAWADRIR